MNHDPIPTGRPVGVRNRPDGPFVVVDPHPGDPADGWLRVRPLGRFFPDVDGAAYSLVVPRDRVALLVGSVGARVLLLAAMRDAGRPVGCAVAAVTDAGNLLVAGPTDVEQVETLADDVTDRLRIARPDLAIVPVCVVSLGAAYAECPDVQEDRPVWHSHDPAPLHQLLVRTLVDAGRLDLADDEPVPLPAPTDPLDPPGLVRAAARLARQLTLDVDEVMASAAELGRLHPATATGDILLALLDRMTRPK